MRACVVLLVLCCVSCTPSRPRKDLVWLDCASTFAKAENSFRQGVESKSRPLAARKHFSDATDAYLSLHRYRFLPSPDLYRNLGNAAVLADRWPEAIWAYHLGLKIDPNDRMLREHLAFARAKILYPPSGQGRPMPDAWPAWVHWPTDAEFSVLRWLAYVTICVVGANVWIKATLRAALVFAGIAIVAIAICIGAEYSLHQKQMDEKTPLVVLAVNADFYRGNATSYSKHADMPFLPRGLEARQLHRRGTWLQIRLTTGEVGWIPAASALIVEP